MKLTFWGAAGTTTGSHHLLEANGRRLALDCGMYQGRRAIAREMNTEFACQPSQVHAMILSHAHIDHSGIIPVFVKQGYRGPIHCTNATNDLARVMLQDSAMIQEKDAAFIAKISRKRGHPEVVEPLYNSEDVDNALDCFQSIGYFREFCPTQGMTVRFEEAGHMLGSAISVIEVDDHHGTRRVCFSGDIGRGRNAILRDPNVPRNIDFLIMESTYGNRRSGSQDDLREGLRQLVQRVADRGGKIIVPAFSVGRTQDIVYHLNALFNEKKLPEIPIFVDSPLSRNVTSVFRQHSECFNRTAREQLRFDPDPFGFERLRYTRTVEESMALNDMPGPMVIISASGMCEVGRILHHLRNNIEDPKNCVLIVGFQAEHTLGRRFVEKAPTVKIFGQEHRVRAEVKVLNGFSAHADAEELRNFVFRVKDQGEALRKIFLVHGERDQQEPFAEWARTTLGVDTHIVSRGDKFEF